jgi:hypothetical protein
MIVSDATRDLSRPWRPLSPSNFQHQNPHAPEACFFLPKTCSFPAMKILHFSPDLAVRISGSNLQ